MKEICDLFTFFNSFHIGRQDRFLESVGNVASDMKMLMALESHIPNTTNGQKIIYTLDDMFIPRLICALV